MELLVVIAIILLLAAILLPALRQARFRSTLAVCGNNIRQCYIATQSYGDDNGGWYPLADESGTWPTPPAGYNGSGYGWSGPPALLYPQYLPDPRVAYCPGLGGLTKWGWPMGGFPPNTTYLMYDFANLRSVDLWFGEPWRNDRNWSNAGYGGVLYRCVSIQYEVDPRAWTHQDFTTEQRNDGSSRFRKLPVDHLQIYGAFNVGVVFQTGYVQADPWWLAQ